jgi:hypothetical protein
MDPDAFGARGLRDAGIRALCRAVRCETLGKPRDAWASEVEIKLKDGRVLARAVDDFPGTPTLPLDTEALRAKYRRCAGGFGTAERLLEQLEHIEAVSDVRTLALG